MVSAAVHVHEGFRSSYHRFGFPSTFLYELSWQVARCWAYTLKGRPSGM
jgi:hypothetical protein